MTALVFTALGYCSMLHLQWGRVWTALLAALAIPACFQPFTAKFLKQVHSSVLQFLGSGAWLMSRTAAVVVVRHATVQGSALNSSRVGPGIYSSIACQLVC